ncbi:MAG: Phage integrase family protein [Verrucomicrobiaceae bacterium]|nr:Phage integrase family protein [Verrucomicrobiaceae bacterium]
MNASKPLSTRAPASLPLNVGEHENAHRNKKSAQKVHTRLSKADVRYWGKKLKKQPKSSDYSIQIAHQGQRHRFPLKTPNKDSAAEKAVGIYRHLVANGWEVTLEKFKPETVKPAKGATVGALIAAVTELATVRARTLSSNISTFRRIVADVEGIKSSASRYAPSGEGRAAWLAAVDAVPLAKLTPDRVEAWKLRFVASGAKGGEVKARTARNSANTMLRMGKSLFSKRLLRFMVQRLELPAILPFDGVGLFPRQSMRYTSTVDIAALLTAANEDLAIHDKEAFKAFLLCLFGGLRRNEADKLRWNSIDFRRDALRVEAQVDFAPKAETSLSDVPLDPEVCTVLRGLRACEPESEYVLAGNAAKTDASWATYRAAATFQRLASWLRSNGLNTRAPLHTLRKEAGSLVCQKGGLLAASRFLRHADVAITAQHYATQKDRVTVGLGSLLAPHTTNVIEARFTDPKPATKPVRKANQA